MSNYFGISIPEQSYQLSAGQNRELTFTVTNNTDESRFCSAKFKFISGDILPYSQLGEDSVLLKPGETTKFSFIILGEFLKDSSCSEFQLLVHGEELPDEIYNVSPVIQFEIIGIEKRAPDWMLSYGKIIAISLASLILVIVGIFSFITIKKNTNRKFEDEFIKAVYKVEGYLERDYPQRSIDFWKSDYDRVQFFQYVYDYQEELSRNLHIEDLIGVTIDWFTEIHNPEIITEILLRINNVVVKSIDDKEYKEYSIVFDKDRVTELVNDKFSEKSTFIEIPMQAESDNKSLNGFFANEACDILGPRSKFMSPYKIGESEYNSWKGVFDPIEKESRLKIEINDQLVPFDDDLILIASQKIGEIDKLVLIEDQLLDIIELMENSNYLRDDLNNEINKILTTPTNINVYNEIIESNKITDYIDSLLQLYEGMNDISSLIERIKINYEFLFKEELELLEEFNVDSNIEQFLIYIRSSSENIINFYKLTSFERLKEYGGRPLLEYLSNSKVDSDDIINSFNYLYFIHKNIINIKREVRDEREVQDALDKPFEVYSYFMNIVFNDKKHILRADPLEDLRSYVESYQKLYIENSSDENEETKQITTREQLIEIKKEKQRFIVEKYDEWLILLGSEKKDRLLEEKGQIKTTNKSLSSLDVPLTDFTVSLLKDNKVIWSKYIKEKSYGRLLLFTGTLKKDVNRIEIKLHHHDFLQLSDIKIVKIN